MAIYESSLSSTQYIRSSRTQNRLIVKWNLGNNLEKYPYGCNTNIMGYFPNIKYASIYNFVMKQVFNSNH
ncbi:hypothetical protein Hanom_Chr14g01310031 [Helianthus anomalus]